MAADVCQGPPEAWPSDVAVLARVARPRPADLLRARRCAYFARLCAGAPAALACSNAINAGRPGTWHEAT
eukprot:7554575-Lingulodinium_polyedra.AAC.1